MTGLDILDRKVEPSPDAFSNEVAGEAVLLQIARGVYYGMDAIGTLIWKGIQDGRSARDICASVAARFDVPVETVEADARQFLKDLADNDIVIVS